MTNSASLAESARSMVQVLLAAAFGMAGFMKTTMPIANLAGDPAAGY